VNEENMIGGIVDNMMLGVDVRLDAEITIIVDYEAST